MHTYVSRRAALEDACSMLASLNAPRLPLFRAIADYQIAVVGIHGPHVRWPGAALARLHIPTVVLIGADIDGTEPDPPPEQWKCRDKPPASARVAIVHGAGREANHYRMAVWAVARFRRLAFVEYRSEHIQGWASLPWRVPPLAIVPRDQVHPVAPMPGVMH